MNELNPKVSVLFAVYQQKDFIRESLESVLTQDYPNIEIIIGDDGSTDGTQEILKEYHARHQKKIQLILSPINTGITANCNRIFEKCTGKYIAFQAGDDIWLPGKLNRQVAYMEACPKCAICYHNLEVFDSYTGETKRLYNNKENFPHSGGIEKLIRYGCFNGAIANMVRSSECPNHGFDMRIPIASDWLFWIETLNGAGEIHYINEVFAKYRIHKNSISNISNQKRIENYVDHLNTLNIVVMKYPALKKKVDQRRSEIFKSAFSLGGKQYRYLVSSKYRLLLKVAIGIKRILSNFFCNKT